MKRKRAKAKAGVEPKVFRLIVHIGAEKTGTSSIQQTLQGALSKLREQGIQYLGLNLENSERKLFSWQKASGFLQFTALAPELGRRQLLEALRSAIADASATGITTAIWSNEALLKYGTTVIEALRELADGGVALDVIAYVRRHDAWARSSYIQWGLRHKTYEGPLLGFNDFITKRPVNFSRHLAKWRNFCGDRLIMRNMDGVGDTLSDFLSLVGIDAAELPIERRNETPSPEMLALHAVYNSQIKSKARISAFTKDIRPSEWPVDQTIDDWLASLLPSPNDLDRIVEACTEDRTLLNTWLAESGQPPIDTTPLPPKSSMVDLGKVTAALAHIVMRQAARLGAIEDKLAALDVAPAIVPLLESPMNSHIDSEVPARPAIAPTLSGAAACQTPVFAISTGRSGSTLVQRILNCHKDLVVWGEHYGFLNGLGQSYIQMSSPEQKLYPVTAAVNKGPGLLLPTLTDPGVGLEWANPWSAEDFASQLRAFICGYFGSRLEPHQRWGFKEIRYNTMPVLRMLHELYPQGRFVFIRRDVEEVARSKVSAFVKEARWSAMSPAEQSERVRKLIAEVREHYRVYDVFMKRFPGAGQIVDFEDLVENPRAVVAALLVHLGLDPERYDWGLAEQVLASIITRTKRDPEIIELIGKVAARLGDAAAIPAKG